MKVNIKQFKKWMLELRSGNYNQSRNTLQDDSGYCCLGVGCKVLIPESELATRNGLIVGVNVAMQQKAPKWLNEINEDFRNNIDRLTSLVRLNDDDIVVIGEERLEHFTFNEIADLLELVYVHKALNK